MKRMLTLALALTLLGSGAASAQGWAYGRDRHEGGPGHGRSFEGRGDSRGRADRRAERRDDRGGYGYRDDYRGEGRPGADRARWSRGQYLPPAYRGGGVDYRVYNLRRPPRGYYWARVGNDYVLAAAATGLILDVIVGGGY